MMALLLISHAILGVASMFLALHLVVWTRGLFTGKPIRQKGTVLLSGWLAGCLAAQFLLGNVIYPEYRVQVREHRLESLTYMTQKAQREGVLPEVMIGRGERLARLFDVKEHAASFATVLGVLLFPLHRRRKKGERSESGDRVLFAAGVVVAGLVWFVGLVGLHITHFEAIPV